jgi:hypothetical protein
MEKLNKEKKIRKKWLMSFLIFSPISIIYLFLNEILIFLSKYNDTINLSNLFGILLGSFITYSFILLLHYYFGYKKKGVNLLKLTVIFWSLSLIKESLDVVNVIISNTQILKNTLTLSIVISYILYIPMAAYYLINCFKLYKINKYLKNKVN